ncbi:ribonuclease III domain-containing protein [Chytriomyces cf. hyalinus JEL632]|nr:ribonuclease III domain-containing protein [Chytriomyces cf. hyalinus JEL632]
MNNTIAGYTFRNASLLKAALVHPGASPPPPVNTLTSFQRLEFLGDAILKMVVSERVFQEYATENEGQLTNRTATLVSADACGRMARMADMHKRMTVAVNADLENSSILCDAFEALVGAVYLDGGSKMGHVSVWLNGFVDKIETENRRAELANPIAALQILCQKTLAFQELPAYTSDCVQDKGVIRLFTSAVSHPNLPNVVGRGQASSIKKAKANAAEDMIQQLSQDLASVKIE